MTAVRASGALNIGIFGTFDVENYGDLLFPLIAEAELSRRLGRVTLTRYSYHRKTEPDWPYAVTSLSELPASASRLDGVLLGGGLVIRFDKHVARGYGPPNAAIHHPTGYWLTPALVAISQGLPLAWNAPGVVDGIPAWADSTLRLVLAASQYVSVRDEASRRALEATRNGASIALVPDSVFGVAALLDAGRRSREVCRMREAAGLPGPYILVQANRDAKSFLRFFRRNRRSFRDYRLLVLPIGPVNGDDDGIFGDDGRDFVRLAGWPDPLALTALISHAEGVVGSSLHLAITALAFGVPVFRPAHVSGGKYAPLSAHRTVHPFEIGAGTAPGWFLQRLGRTSPEPDVASMSPRLEEHWDRIAGVFEAGRMRTPAVLESLSLFWQALPGLLETVSHHEEIRARDARIVALENSRSWRVTAPLRGIGRRLSRFRQKET